MKKTSGKIKRAKDWPVFKKSSFCFDDVPGGCVHVRNLGGIVIKDKAGKMVMFSHGEWDAFIKGVKAGEFDL